MAAGLGLSCCLHVCGAADPALLPISRGQAERILADTDTLASELQMQISEARGPGQSIVLDDVRSVMSHSSEWRWYSRDHGILVAIPVRERLGIGSKVDGEKALEDIVRRLVNQNGWGNPPVQVIFIEPEVPCPGTGFPRSGWTNEFRGVPGFAAACDCH